MEEHRCVCARQKSENIPILNDTSKFKKILNGS